MRNIIVMIAVHVSLFLGAQPVPLHCWIVRSAEGLTQNSLAGVSNSVDIANRCFSQVAMSFEIASINYIDNDSFRVVNFTNQVQYLSLCNVTNNTGGLEVYFVDRVDGGANAFQLNEGIVIGKERSTDFTLAHEIGHACGLSDIYDFWDGMSVTGMPQKAYFTHDWGWYPENVTQAQIVQRLLMYGYDIETKGDISRGDVYGVWYEYEWNPMLNSYYKHWHLSNAPVGFKLHGNRHPVSE